MEHFAGIKDAASSSPLATSPAAFLPCMNMLHFWEEMFAGLSCHEMLCRQHQGCCKQQPSGHFSCSFPGPSPDADAERAGSKADRHSRGAAGSAVGHCLPLGRSDLDCSGKHLTFACTSSVPCRNTVLLRVQSKLAASLSSSTMEELYLQWVAVSVNANQISQVRPQAPCMRLYCFCPLSECNASSCPEQPCGQPVTMLRRSCTCSGLLPP